MPSNTSHEKAVMALLVSGKSPEIKYFIVIVFIDISKGLLHHERVTIQTAFTK